jgi:O-antigen ligase
MNLRKILFYLFCLLLICVPFSVEMGNRIRLEIPLELFLVGYNVLLGIYALRKDINLLLKDNIVFAVAMMAVMSGISILDACIPMAALKAWIIWINYCFAFFGSFLLLDFTDKEIKTFIKVFSTAYIALLTYAFAKYLMIGIHYQNSYIMAKPFATGHTLLIAMGFPLWLFLAHNIFKKIATPLQIALFIGYSGIILISYSRFYWVFAPLFTGLFAYFYWIEHRKKIIWLGIIFALIGGTAFYVIKEKRDREQAWLDPDDHNSSFVQLQSIFDLKTNESNRERFNRWKVGMEMVKSNIWTGVGLNNYAEVFPTFSQNIFLKRTTRTELKMNAHQWYLGTLYEQGLLGLLALAGFIWAWAQRGKQHSFLAWMIAIHYLALGMIEDYMLLAETVPMFWMCVGLSAYLQKKEVDKK